ncbi:MAG: hypothetical protein ACK5MK_02940 [Dysgonomonas sp.]
MKAKFLLLVMLIMFGMQGFSEVQDDEIFPTSDAIWVIHLYYYEGGQFIYGLQGDTIINEKIYQRLYLLNDSTLNIDSGDIYVAGIRQADKKVWVQPADKKDGTQFEEFLMYDFSQTEDARIDFGKRPLMGLYNFCPTFECVDTASLNNSVKGSIYSDIPMGSVIYVSYDDSGSGDEWVYGIGSLRGGLYYFPPRFLSGEGGEILGSELICMKKGNEVKYLKEGCCSCFKTQYNSVNSDEIEKNNISVIYDATSHKLDISSEEIMRFPLLFELITINGNILQKEIITEEKNSVAINQPLSGVYLYRISGSNVNQNGKLLIK